jgi:MFS family permease
MSIPSSSAPSGARRRHRAIASLLFVVLGLHVGAWSVQIAALAVGLDLDPGPLGIALSAGAAGGIVTLVLGGRIADRAGRKPVLLVGLVGTGLAFALLGAVQDLGQTVAVVLLYGLAVSFVDLGANLVGTDYEHAHDAVALTGLQAGFSAGAVVGALGATFALAGGADYRVVYGGMAALFALAAALVALAALPPRSREGRRADGGRSVPVLRIAGVLFAAVVVTTCFFGDGALEGFLALFLRRAVGAGVLLSGLGVASFHAASFAGRVLADRVLQRAPAGRVISVAGVLAAIGITTAITAPGPGLAIAGLLVTGFAIAPIVPSGLSLAARSAPERPGQAVAAVTAVGYSSFLLSPLAVGALASAADLRVGLGVVVVTSLALAAYGLRWPTRRTA